MHNESTDQDAGDTSADKATSRLRDLREAAGKSVDEVADALHLDRNVILALEEGDYAVLGAPVFVKGHLRSYARLLGLPDDELAGNFQVVEPEAEEFRTLSVQPVVRPGANLSNFFLWVLLVLIVLIGAIYLLLGDDEEPASDFVTPVSIAGINPPVEEILSPGGSEAEDADRAVELESELELESEPEPEPESEPEQSEPGIARDEFITADVIEAESGVVAVEAEQSELQAESLVQEQSQQESEQALLALTLRFTAECWVEVSDSRRRLLYGLEKAGSERVLRGQPPFRLFLGNTNAVEIQVAGRDYVVPRAVRTGSNTARFVIDAETIAELTEQ